MPTETFCDGLSMTVDVTLVTLVLPSMLDSSLIELKGPETFLDLDCLLVGLILLWNAVQCSAWSLT
jgi:hypothetical protein